MRLLYDLIAQLWNNKDSSRMQKNCLGQQSQEQDLSEEEIILEEIFYKEEYDEGDYESVSREIPWNAETATSDFSDGSQIKNANRKVPGDVVTNKITASERHTGASWKESGDVSIANKECTLQLGAEHDKQRADSTRVIARSALTLAQEENRRASFSGMTVMQKQNLQIKDNMPPSTLESEIAAKPDQRCDIRQTKSDVGEAFVVKRLYDVKRQFSSSSTNSNQSGIDITMGGESDLEDENEEIKLPDIPDPSFTHRHVTIKNATYKHFYDLKEPIGGGRFGRVYRCVEKKTGLQLAAKCFQCKKPLAKSLLKAKSLQRAQTLKTSKRTQQEPVDKEDVMIEIDIMNQTDHRNIVKLYDAYENENNMILIMEYLGGGELFERVIADHSQLTELDAVLFMKQIVTAVQYLHKNLILHLDLKPENILCLDRSTHHLKLIDFGLARKYNPRQKLLIQWGTPEFMAPEMLNYETVSFPSDMWSVGIICYILLSGMSPFLGEDDSDTMANIIECDWDFNEPAFETVSDEAKDFISRLLVEEKSGRMSAAQCLRHDWLATPITGKRRKALMNKTQLKNFMARMQWKASIAAVSAANWLKQKVNNVAENVMASDTPV